MGQQDPGMLDADSPFPRNEVRARGGKRVRVSGFFSDSWHTVSHLHGVLQKLG